MQKTCIIVPCYNEEKRLDLSEFEKFSLSNKDISFLFSNDGSTDKTELILTQFCERNSDSFSLYSMKVNSGKAEAVRCALLYACQQNKYEYVGFWDADLATPLEEIPYFINQLNQANKKIAIGSRMKRLGATVERKKSRHFLGRIFSTFSSIILKLPVYDTQCGAKIFHSSLFDLFEEKFITKWLFDIELIARYRNKHGIGTALNTIIEVPVNTWIEKGGSKLKLTYMLKVPFELMKINNKYNYLNE